ncbi:MULTISPECIES: SGNH/GDSL hydrolase family protein [unclassified Streptomyces]|uniref:SGNH/GDSL hydrolase family protein n=1 Tax=unclassified Streptomyces TaxID=2593676 RepID=UPI002E12EF6E|nr:SGNH/GDSL hydrolase family protein [Streptomyces sp. NBC_01197]WSS53211.1 SGNH/GDSL hydrolase family protein [Streptomyces sp. NBC_01180]
MPLQLPSRATVLFQGDSITDAGRVSHPTAGLGHGYAGMSAELLRAAHPDSDYTFVNRGVGGDRIADLRARWHEDGVALAPDLLSVMIGVNDTWRRYDRGDLTTIEAYEDDYRHILTRIRESSGAQLLLIEPFLVPVLPEQWAWREDLDPRIQVVRRLAEEFGAALLAADGLLNQAARSAGGAAHVAGDGVHPTPFGHRVLARAWVELVSAGPGNGTQTGPADSALDGAAALGTPDH